jgi:AraC-like DNA-binding protein
MLPILDGSSTNFADFKSKSTFIAAFKAVHGIRPVDWFKGNL